jgi:hypothetical protein
MSPIENRSLALPETPSPAPASPNAPPKQPADDAPSPFALLVRRFSGEADRGAATVHRVLDAGGRGIPLDPTSLLALQAGVYRYGQTMDLAARLVDKVSSGAKTVLQGS